MDKFVGYGTDQEDSFKHLYLSLKGQLNLPKHEFQLQREKGKLYLTLYDRLYQLKFEDVSDGNPLMKVSLIPIKSKQE